MSNSLNTQNGAKFVAIIKLSECSHFVECFLRSKPLAPGFPSAMEHVFSNLDMPSFPAMPLQQAQRIAINRARSLGYLDAEIVWKDERGFPSPLIQTP